MNSYHPIHYYVNVEETKPYRTVHIVGDMLNGYRSMEKLVDTSEHFIPCHDPIVMERYPAPSKETKGIVVRLDADLLN